MNTEKLLAEIIGELPLISVNTESSAPTFFDEEPAFPTLSNQPSNVTPVIETAPVAPPTDTAVRRAEQAKSLLAGLDLNTAIRRERGASPTQQAD
ncbi:hypothetical protein [Bradyrhizobium genosp. P]|uniref:hypothetical protein n=1 Tax=Bradyrhizobium genosp. P TaxID=83641 RepID=UPI003CFA5DAC